MRRVLLIGGMTLWLFSCGNSANESGQSDTTATGGNATGEGGSVNTGGDRYNGTENGAGTGTGTGTGVGVVGGATSGSNAGSGGAGTHADSVERNRQ